MKAVGNGRENSLTTSVTVFFTRERERLSGKRNRNYGMPETIQSDRKYVGNGREPIILSGNINAHNHFNHSI